jgi:hypothetical protein
MKARRDEGMGVTLEFLNDNRGVRAVASGELTGEDFVAAARQVNVFAATVTPICYTFCDCDRLTAITVTTGDLAAAALCAIEAAELRDTERIVAIYASDDYVYRLALIYMTFIEQTGWEAWAFRDRAEAVGWLRARAALKHGITVEVD